MFHQASSHMLGYFPRVKIFLNISPGPPLSPCRWWSGVWQVLLACSLGRLSFLWWQFFWWPGRWKPGVEIVEYLGNGRDICEGWSDALPSLYCCLCFASCHRVPGGAACSNHIWHRVVSSFGGALFSLGFICVKVYLFHGVRWPCEHGSLPRNEFSVKKTTTTSVCCGICMGWIPGRYA